MTPTPDMLDELATLLANDTASLAPAVNAVRVHLAMADFNPDAVLVPGDLTEATFVGSAFLEADVGPQQSFVDPITGNRVVQLLEPVGGWHWQATAGTSLPQPIYGWYVTDHADAILWASEKFEDPITITAIGDGLDIGNIRFQIPTTALE